jgi:hypothetical protein
MEKQIEFWLYTMENRIGGMIGFIVPRLVYIDYKRLEGQSTSEYIWVVYDT